MLLLATNSYGHVEHGNEKVKVLIAKHRQPIRDGKNKGSNHCGTLKPGDAVLVCERWVEVATTITRLRIRVRDEDDGYGQHLLLSSYCSRVSASFSLSRSPLARSVPHAQTVVIRRFSRYYTGWVRLADRDPDNPGNPKQNPADSCRRDLFDMTLGCEQLGEATETLEV